MMHISTQAILVTAFVVQGVTGGIMGAKVLVDAKLPPAVEGSGYFSGTAMPGESIPVLWQIVKRTECPGLNSRSWDGEDGFHITETLKPTSLPTTDGFVEYLIETKVPDLAPPGELRLTIKGWYECPGADKEPFTLGPVLIMVEG